MKRLFDVVVSALVLILVSPILLFFVLLVWMQDWRSPLYFAPRVARGGRTFKMVKLRSMVVNADRTGVTSTAAGDSRITPIGRMIRKLKLDELTQLWNVLCGDMSLVGPRPNTWETGVNLYTPVERELLTVRPGITDFSSIVFSDESEILAGSPDPELAYNQLIRPWKSRLSLFYIGHRSLLVDVRLIAFTALAIVSRPRALKGVSRLLEQLGAPAELVEISQRRKQLVPTLPPGASETEMSPSATN
jgi:lipopolysaccharide/colanic/teichoic acid biosynthesis glycosyltransferase